MGGMEGMGMRGMGWGKLDDRNRMGCGGTAAYGEEG